MHSDTRNDETNSKFSNSSSDEKQSDNTEKLSREYKQDELLFKELHDSYKQKVARLKIILIVVIASAIPAAVMPWTLFVDASNDLGEVVAIHPVNMKTGYLIQNLKGDTVDTWVAWKIFNENNLFHVHVLETPELTEEITDAIYDTITSSKSLNIDDSLLHKGPKGTFSKYYAGWFGALNDISANTLYPIPKNLHFHITAKGEGDVIVKVTNLRHPDGYDGYTKSFVDDTNNQILKSEITIFEVDKKNIAEIMTIVRHELGHAFGIAHSTTPEDLMYPVIETNYPYISECDIDALVLLYNGSEKSQVICEK